MIHSNVASFRWKSHGAKNSNLFLSFFMSRQRKSDLLEVVFLSLLMITNFVSRCQSVSV